MLGYVQGGGRGSTDRLLEDIAVRLEAEAWPLAGVVQINRDAGAGRACDMDLRVLGRDGRVICISQSLGALARGCRLDPQGLALAAGMVEQSLHQGPRLLIVNKFGKSEAEGGGFRPAIGRALAEGIPVLCSVADAQRSHFEDFAGGLAEALAADPGTVLSWCRRTAIPVAPGLSA